MSIMSSSPTAISPTLNHSRSHRDPLLNLVPSPRPPSPHPLGWSSQQLSRQSPNQTCSHPTFHPKSPTIQPASRANNCTRSPFGAPAFDNGIQYPSISASNSASLIPARLFISQLNHDVQQHHLRSALQQADLHIQITHIHIHRSATPTNIAFVIYARSTHPNRTQTAFDHTCHLQVLQSRVVVIPDPEGCLFAAASSPAPPKSEQTCPKVHTNQVLTRRNRKQGHRAVAEVRHKPGLPILHPKCNLNNHRNYHYFNSPTSLALAPNTQQKTILYSSNSSLPLPSTSSATFPLTRTQSRPVISQPHPMHSAHFSPRHSGRTPPAFPPRHPPLPHPPPSRSRSTLPPSPTRFSPSHDRTPLSDSLPSHSIYNSTRKASRFTPVAPTSDVASKHAASISPNGHSPHLIARKTCRRPHHLPHHSKNSAFHSSQSFNESHADNRNPTRDVLWNKRIPRNHEGVSYKNEPTSGVGLKTVFKRRRSFETIARNHDVNHEPSENPKIHFHSYGWGYDRLRQNFAAGDIGSGWQHCDEQNTKIRNLDNKERRHNSRLNGTSCLHADNREYPHTHNAVPFSASALPPICKEPSVASEPEKSQGRDSTTNNHHDHLHHPETPLRKFPAKEPSVDGIANNVHDFIRSGIGGGQQQTKRYLGENSWLDRCPVDADKNQHQLPKGTKIVPPIKENGRNNGSFHLENKTPVQDIPTNDGFKEDNREYLRSDCSATIFDIPNGVSALDLRHGLSRVGVTYVSSPVNRKAVLKFATPGRRAAAVARGYLLLTTTKLNIRLCKPGDLTTNVHIKSDTFPATGIKSAAVDPKGSSSLTNESEKRDDSAAKIIEGADNISLDEETLKAVVFKNVMIKIMGNVVQKIGAENYSTGFREVFDHVEGKWKEESRKLAEKRVENRVLSKRDRTLADRNLDEYLMGSMQDSKMNNHSKIAEAKKSMKVVKIPRKGGVGSARETHDVAVTKNDEPGDASLKDLVFASNITRKIEIIDTSVGMPRKVLEKSTSYRERSVGIDDIDDNTPEANRNTTKDVEGSNIIKKENVCGIQVSDATNQGESVEEEHPNIENPKMSRKVGCCDTDETPKGISGSKRGVLLDTEADAGLLDKKNGKVIAPVAKRRRKALTVLLNVCETHSGIKEADAAGVETKSDKKASVVEIVKPGSECEEDSMQVRKEEDQRYREEDEQQLIVGKQVSENSIINEVGEKAHAMVKIGSVGPDWFGMSEVPITTLTKEDLLEAELSSLKKRELEDAKVRDGTCARTEGIRWIRGCGMLKKKDGKDNGKVRVVRPQGEAGKESVRANRQEQRLLRKTMRQISADVEGLTLNVLQQRRKKVYTRKSAIHGMGLYAQESIGVGELVIEYVGSVVRRSVADVREMRYEEQGIGDSYMFRMNSDAVIDATYRGGIGRYINHSCEPNLIAKIIAIGSEDHIVFYSKKPIRVHDELTYDYKFAVEGDDQKIPCLCQAQTCRKFLN